MAIARMNREKAVDPKPMEMPSTIHINMKKHKMDKTPDVGDEVTMHVTAKVTGHNEDEYGHTMRMESMKMKHV